MDGSIDARIAQIVAETLERLLPPPQTTPPVRLLLPIPDAAEALGIGVTTLKGLIAAGEIGAVSIGRRRLIPMETLHDYVRGLREGA